MLVYSHTIHAACYLREQHDLPDRLQVTSKSTTSASCEIPARIFAYDDLVRTNTRELKIKNNSNARLGGWIDIRKKERTPNDTFGPCYATVG